MGCLCLGQRCVFPGGLPGCCVLRSNAGYTCAHSISENKHKKKRAFLKPKTGLMSELVHQRWIEVSNSGTLSSHKDHESDNPPGMCRQLRLPVTLVGDEFLRGGVIVAELSTRF